MMDETCKNKLPQCRFYAVLVCAKKPKRTGLLLNRSCTTVSAKIEGIFISKLTKTFHFQIRWSKACGTTLGGLKIPNTCPKARQPLIVRWLGPAANKGALASKFMHKGLGAPHSSHILIYVFQGDRSRMY